MNLPLPQIGAYLPLSAFPDIDPMALRLVVPMLDQDRMPLDCIAIPADWLHHDDGGTYVMATFVRARRGWRRSE